MEGKERRSERMRTSVAAGILLIAIAFAFIAVTPAVAQPVEVRVNAPESGYVEEGGTFVVTIDMDSVTDLSSAQFDLSFDKSVVKVTDVEDGEVNSEDIPIYMWVLSKDKDAVRVILHMPIGEAVSGSGYLAKVEFEVKGDEGEKSELNFSDVRLYNVRDKKIPANWHGAEVTIGVPPTLEEDEDDDDEDSDDEEGEEVTPGSPNITAWSPVEAIVNNTVGEPRAFNVTIDQIADISWQINGTEVQINESVTEAIYRNTSADIGTWNVSAIATNATTGLSDMHTWIWSVTLTPAATPTPTPTLAPGVTSAPEAEAGAEGTPTSQEKEPVTKEKATPVPTAAPTPKQEVPGFEAVFAIAVMLGLGIVYILQRRR